MNTNKKPGSIPNQFQNIKSEFESQKKNPPGGDQYIADCYGALLKLIETDDTYTIDIIKHTLHHRPYITPQYFANLFFRAVQYIELYKINNDFNGVYSYPIRLATQEDWEKELAYLFELYVDDIKTILKDKNTVTTIYQRYAGPQILINAFRSSDSVTVADFGCGGNFGLPGIELGVAYEKIDDESPEKLATSLLHPMPTLKQGLAFDKEDPREENAKEWRISCSFYPSEFSKLAQTLVLEDEIAKACKTHFTPYDLTEVCTEEDDGILPQGSADFVVISTMLYQLSPEERETVLINAEHVLAPGGAIIIQDFAVKDADTMAKLDFNTTWFSKKTWSYRTFMLGDMTEWQFKEILRWSNGRCRAVCDGEDFQFMAATAALEHSTS